MSTDTTSTSLPRSTRWTRAAAAVAASLALGAGLALTAPGADAQAAGCTIHLSSYPTIKTGAKGQAATAAECLLHSAGEGVSRNGHLSSADVQNVKRFQGRVGLDRSGTIGRGTWTALLAHGGSRTLRSGSEGGDVKRLQSALTASGRPTKATGRYYSPTSSQVKSLQKAMGVRQTGRTDSAVWKALQAGRHTIAPPKKPAAATTTKADKAVAFAKQQLGDRYVYGGTGPSSWDCSGLTQGAWKAAGVSIPRTSQSQYSGVSRKVSKGDLRPGDVVFFYSGRSHTGLYVGDGYIIHASRPGQPVAKVKMSTMPFNGAVRPA
ncbi:C40 family peptidase [Auraticoccus monumenti]|uniref:Putative peptidoglycan binding domain-containing protein n=1 Tax=Auraticoccus monumenti TaxID=675864 RepID=A0A1G6WZU0_9ACTN|nr:NlpC/P60 family protein [Auraticoccus monumenti]SDD71361.1 Putative peptidoglycan binding domain-containing protein [Auraticoccus monumenti]